MHSVGARPTGHYGRRPESAFEKHVACLFGHHGAETAHDAGETYDAGIVGDNDGPVVQVH